MSAVAVVCVIALALKVQSTQSTPLTHVVCHAIRWCTWKYIRAESTADALFLSYGSAACSKKLQIPQWQCEQYDTCVKWQNRSLAATQTRLSLTDNEHFRYNVLWMARSGLALIRRRRPHDWQSINCVVHWKPAATMCMSECFGWGRPDNWVSRSCITRERASSQQSVEHVFANREICFSPFLFVLVLLSFEKVGLTFSFSLCYWANDANGVLVTWFECWAATIGLPKCDTSHQLSKRAIHICLFFFLFVAFRRVCGRKSKFLVSRNRWIWIKFLCRPIHVQNSSEYLYITHRLESMVMIFIIAMRLPAAPNLIPPTHSPAPAPKNSQMSKNFMAWEHACHTHTQSCQTTLPNWKLAVKACPKILTKLSPKGWDSFKRMFEGYLENFRTNERANEVNREKKVFRFCVRRDSEECWAES